MCKTRILVFVIIPFSVFLSQGCKKFVQVGTPSTLISTASVYNDINTATSALTSIYTKMFSATESYNMALNEGFLSDELTSNSTVSYLKQFYTNSMSASDDNGVWNRAYYYIYQANDLITNFSQNANKFPGGQQLIGEAKFIRAFWYFYLVNEYGDVPLVTTTEYTINSGLSRTPKAQVYSQMIEDLQDATTMLNVNYVDASDTAVTTDRVRPNQGAAEALLSRVYLFSQKYDSAATEASLVINNTKLYGLCTNLSPLMGQNSVFLMNSMEAIWQLGTVSPLPSSNTYDAQYFILLAAPSTGSHQCATISPQLLNSFEAGDLRRVNWIDSFTTKNPVEHYYFPYKYQSNKTTTLTEYTMVLRLAEQYLIRAEAQVYQNNPSGAIADLNVIRERAGLSPYTGATDQGSILAAILHERQVELFSEWGHRWYDLIRTGNANAVMGAPGNVCSSKGGSWNSNWLLFPIGQSEIVNDPHLTQNLGY
jgi:hypothetical protein